MATVYNSKKIVSSGLVLHLDAANIKSYIGSGTVCYDISGNSKNGSLINSPSFVPSQSRSYFTNFTSNQYIEISTSYVGPVTLPTGSSPRTIMAGFRSPSTITGYQHIVHYGSEIQDRAFGLAIYQSLLNNHTWAGNSNCSNQTITADTDYIVAVKFNNNSTPRNTFFINGAFGVTGYGQGKATDYVINTGNAFQLRLGTRISSVTEFLGTGGRIYFVLVYNRDLSDSEIQQNYTVLKDRYGI